MTNATADAARAADGLASDRHRLMALQDKLAELQRQHEQMVLQQQQDATLRKIAMLQELIKANGNNTSTSNTGFNAYQQQQQQMQQQQQQQVHQRPFYIQQHQQQSSSPPPQLLSQDLTAVSPSTNTTSSMASGNDKTAATTAAAADKQKSKPAADSKSKKASSKKSDDKADASRDNVQKRSRASDPPMQTSNHLSAAAAAANLGNFSANKSPNVSTPNYISDPGAFAKIYAAIMQQQQQRIPSLSPLSGNVSPPGQLSPPSAGAETPQAGTNRPSSLALDGSGLHAMSVAAAQASAQERAAQTVGSLGLEAPPLHSAAIAISPNTAGTSPTYGHARRSSVFAGSASQSPSQQQIFQPKTAMRRPSLPPSFKMARTMNATDTGDARSKSETAPPLIHMQALADAAAAAAEVTRKGTKKESRSAAKGGRRSSTASSPPTVASLSPSLTGMRQAGRSHSDQDSKKTGAQDELTLESMPPLNPNIRFRKGPNLAVGPTTATAADLSAMSRIPSAPASGRRASTKSKRRNSARQAGKICHFQGCEKLARSTTLFCASHGGGRRCHADGCSKSARGSTNFCIAHGGGRRCKHDGCRKSAQGSTDFCIAHGGGRRCKQDNCDKSARGPTGFCKAHGGGKRCLVYYCYKSAIDGSDFCKPHAQQDAITPGGAATAADNMDVARRSSVNSISSNFSLASGASAMSTGSFQPHHGLHSVQ